MLHPSIESTVTDLTAKYKRMAAMMGGEQIGAADSSATDDADCIRLAIRAQLLTIHELLEQDMPKEWNDAGDKEYTTEEAFIESLNHNDQTDETGAKRRARWLAKVNAAGDLMDAPRIRHIVDAVRILRHGLPTEKIVIFSQYIKVLDILERCLRVDQGVACLRFDSTVNRQGRLVIQKKFADPTNEYILLITAGAGGTGLNITAASIIIQTEVWWNANTELQAAQRLWRQKQEKDVVWLRFECKNSMIDQEMKRVQSGKTRVITELMKPLIRRDDEGPDIRSLKIFPGLAPLPVPMLVEGDSDEIMKDLTVDETRSTEEMGDYEDIEVEREDGDENGGEEAMEIEEN
jgi:SNF2 family DNA or RNA helicase